MTVMVMFVVELMTMRYGVFGSDHDTHDHGNGHNHSYADAHTNPDSVEGSKGDVVAQLPPSTSHAPHDDHLGHVRSHQDNDQLRTDWEEQGIVPESYAAQLTAIFILEFGVVFHSIFIGLTLAVAGEEFKTLYVVLVFHQTFEGLGLGSRLSAITWPKSRRWTPYFLGMGYAISTPIAIAIGIGVRQTFTPGSPTTLITNGVFDSISAGILIYTGLVELMAHEFMFSPTMQKAPIGTVLSALGLMCLGAGEPYC
jgi:solute carrier family 39 (zinc transporter), member 1/2/3